MLGLLRVALLLGWEERQRLYAIDKLPTPHTDICSVTCMVVQPLVALAMGAVSRKSPGGGEKV